MNTKNERIILPNSIKKVLGWDERTPLEIWVDGTGERIILMKHECKCIFCNETQALKE